MKKLKTIGVVTMILLAWTTFIGMGFINGYLLRPINTDETPEAFIEACKEQLENEFVGNLAIALTENGQVKTTLFHTHDGTPIDGNSAFPVASISKWVTSVGVLRLVEQGKIDLDQPLDNYLTRWHLPESDYDNKEVTVRRLLSHSAGLADGLGYGGFKKHQPLQSLEESLTLAADRGDATGKAKVTYPPGSEFMYSGASYTLLQLLIEEVSGMNFSDYMQQEVFQPLGMTHSSFNLADSAEIGLVKVYKNDSSVRPMARFTAKSAASLMTSTQDLSQFIMHLAADQPTILSQEMIQQMNSAQSYRSGFAYYGLGPKLYTQGKNEVKIVGHDGSGNNAINSAARWDITTGDGIIILETGHLSFASNMSDEWNFWKAGIADRVVMERNLPYLTTLLIFGYVLIIGVSIWFVSKRTQRLPK